MKSSTTQRSVRFSVLCISAILICLLLVGSGSGIATGATLPSADTAPNIENTEALQSGTTNTSDAGEADDLLPPHRNPSTLESDSELSRVETVLSAALAERISQSSVKLNASEYERAKELLGTDYSTDLRRYAEIAEETNTEETATTFRTVQSTQKDYTESVETYDKTVVEYREAQASGDTQRARALAREVVNSADELNSTGEQTQTAYRALEQTTGANFTEETQRVEQKQTEATQTRQQIVATELVETNLSVATDTSQLSFTDAVTITGSLRTDAGEPIAQQEVRFLVNNRSYTVATDADGSFQLRVRPSGVWEVGSPTLQYIPDPQSVYLGTTATLPVTVDTTATKTTINAVDTQASYDSPITAEGELTTPNGTPVPLAPVEIRIDGQPRRTVQTNAAGKFDIDAPVPATIPAGTVRAEIGLQPSQLALTTSEQSAAIEIEPTQSNLSIEATSTGPGEIQVRGQLASAGGRPVSGMPVEIEIADTSVGAVETGAEGGFTTTYRPDSVGSGSTVRVEATFAGANSHLEAAVGRATVETDSFIAASSSNPTASNFVTDLFSNPSAVVLMLVSILSGGITVGWWFWWRSPRDQETTPDTSADSTVDTPAEPDMSTAEVLLSAADDALQDGASKSAVKLAYTAVKHATDADIQDTATLTHWEWYQACNAAGVDKLSQIEEFITDFEQVVFTPPDEKTSKTAERAVETAQQLILL